MAHCSNSYSLSTFTFLVISLTADQQFINSRWMAMHAKVPGINQSIRSHPRFQSTNTFSLSCLQSRSLGTLSPRILDQEDSLEAPLGQNLAAQDDPRSSLAQDLGTSAGQGVGAHSEASSRMGETRAQAHPPSPQDPRPSQDLRPSPCSRGPSPSRASPSPPRGSDPRS